MDRRDLIAESAKKMAKTKAEPKSDHLRPTAVAEINKDPNAGISGPKVARGGRLNKKELSKYIQEQLGDGKELADFYLAILRCEGPEAKNSGVWLSHRLQAADWLAQRGWGRPKGEDDGKGQGLTIEITNYGEVKVSPPPRVINTTSEEVEFSGPKKFDAELVEQPRLVEPEGERTVGPQETKTPTPVLTKVEQLNERFEPIEVEIE